MRNRLFFSFVIIIVILILVFPGISQGMNDEESDVVSKIGIIDLAQIKAKAPRFIQLQKEAEKAQQELEESTAKILSEHRQQIKDLLNTEEREIQADPGQSRQENYYLRSQELAVETQRKIDQKKQELERIQLVKEEAVMEEFKAVLEKVIKKKKLECILLKGGFYVGGNDVTENVLKTWEKWGLTYWQRVKYYFTGTAGQNSVREDNKDLW